MGESRKKRKTMLFWFQIRLLRVMLMEMVHVLSDAALVGALRSAVRLVLVGRTRTLSEGNNF